VTETAHPRAVLRPTFRTGAVLAALLAASAVGWLITLNAGTMDEMMVAPAAAASFVAAWVAMMVAMMLPSAAPFVLLYAAGAGRRLGTALLAGGYIAVWAAFGVLAYVAQVGVDAVGMGEPQAYVAAGALLAAGVYQLTPLKAACLRRCRSPVAFLMERWRGGRLGAARLGADHGLYCLGCCWALMVVLVVAGAMSIVWVAAIAAAVFVEKIFPLGETAARVFGVVLLALGIAVALRPDLAMSIRI
jgi:predicted metal-binding membrane protein